MVLGNIDSSVVSTFAWYQTSSSAAVSSAAVTTDLSTQQTTIGIGEFSITLHVYSGASGTSDDFENVQLSDLVSTTLKKGTYNSTGGAAVVQSVEEAEFGNFVKQLRVEVEWNVKPTEQAAINQFKNKKITGAYLLAEGNAKLLSSHSYAASGIVDYTKAAITVYVDNTDDLVLTVNSVQAVNPANDELIAGPVSIGAMRIATNNTSGAEWYDATDAAAGHKFGQTADTHVPGEGSPVYHHTDAIGIASVASLTIGTK